MPNAQGGYTYEEEQEAIARAMQTALESQSFAPEQNPTVEQQNQQVSNNMATALASQGSFPEEQGGILEALSYGLGPPYTASEKSYAGPPPMEAQPDWNYDSGYPGNWHDFTGNTSTGGGFFAFDELYRGPVPWAFQRGSNLPSTNNYRLLPPEYRKPNFIMRNGQIIDMQGVTNYGPRGGSHTMGEERGQGYPKWRSGAPVGYPVAYANGPISWAVSGWPGQLAPYSYHSTD